MKTVVTPKGVINGYCGVAAECSIVVSEKYLALPAVLIRSAILVALVCFSCITTSCSTILGSEYNSDSKYSGYINYTVKPGDTLVSIASRYRTTPAQIIKTNKLTNANKIYVGQVLRVRSGKYADDYSSMNVNAGRMIWPVENGGRLTSKFGPRGRSFHDGIDIAAPTGTPVLASHDGHVIYADNKLRGYGNLVILRGSGNTKTVYAHNHRMLVRKNQRVKKGQKIAEVGSTGRSTGPHLHYEIRTVDKKGRHIAVDPLPILTRSGEKSDYRVNNNITAIIVEDEKRQR